MPLPDWFLELAPVTQALLAGLLTWGLTASGAALVLFARRAPRRLLDGMLGFSGGVMLAASYWSLLAPAIEAAADGPLPVWIPPAVGFMLGAGCLWMLDKVLPHLHLNQPVEMAEGPATTWHRSILLVSAITLHNIPEGLAVGVAFAGANAGIASATVAGAAVLALGIGIQNVPEGVAVAMPLRAEGLSRRWSFFYGQVSAAVEPVAAVLGAAVVAWSAPVLPYALSFAAGAMVFVVVEELIPESHAGGNADLATLSLVAGFVVMMVLDVALG